MKVDVNQALDVAAGIMREQANKAKDKEETIEETRAAVAALVGEGYKEDVIFTTLSRLNVDKSGAVTNEMVREMIAEARQSTILSPGDSAPIGEGNKEPWKEFNQSAGTETPDNTETPPPTDDSQ